jgi:hypothetical protein
MDFDALIAIARTQRQHPEVLIIIPEEWSQGRTVSAAYRQQCSTALRRVC